MTNNQLLEILTTLILNLKGDRVELNLGSKTLNDLIQLTKENIKRENNNDN